MILYTIGFSGKSAEDFFSLLIRNNVCNLIDIRLNNKSQLSGFANVKHLPYFLKLHKIKYYYKPEYAPTKELLNGYKNKTISWEEYENIYYKLINERDITKNINWAFFDNSTFLCSELTAEKCHRRLLAEFLAKKNSDIKIRHL
jgi:uncharacterized protein (DUF488 family)